ncbi:hypothetical protein [Streptomyces anulatus]|uniref:hypothetical protein n=1 Tax=Streptomyces anulatus TaxID=1892 RepID=UPI003655ADA2
MRCATALDLTTHRRANRGMGPAREEWINQAHNLLLVCTICNDWFEGQPRRACEAGWKVRRPVLPSEVPVWHADGRDYRLTPSVVRSTVVAVTR